MTRDHDYFQLWYVEPLHALENMQGGHAGFIALATACFLYERYATAALSAQGHRADREAKVNQLASDFGIDHETADIFWDVVRDGLLHQGMPMQKKQGKALPKWAFYHDYPPLALENIRGELWLKVQPWKFMNKVLGIWDSNFELLAQNGSFPWASIGAVPA
jgi:hypothetical protein